MDVPLSGFGEGDAARVIALERSAMHSRLITEVVLQGVFQVDTQEQIVFANSAGQELCGYSGDQVNHRSILTFFPDDKALFKSVREQFASGQPLVRETHLLHKNGACLPVLLSLVPLVGDDGQYLGMICTAMDISQRKKAEEEAQLLSMAINQADESIVISEESGRVLYANQAFERLCGYCREEIVGKTLRVLRSGKQNAAYYEEMWSTILSGKTWSGQLINKRKDGSLYSEYCVISPVRDPVSDRVYFVSFKRDVSWEDEWDRQRQSAHKMRTLGLLAGGVAHDFRNVLQGILGLCDLMQMGIVGPTEMEQCVRDIRAETVRGSELTRDLIAFMRDEPQGFSAVDLDVLVNGLQKTLSRLFGQRVELVCHAESAGKLVLAVASQLEQVIMNLCLNARDALPTGGVVMMSTYPVCLSVEEMQDCPQAREGEYVCLSVSDSGEGMTDEVQEQLFKPLFTTKPKGKGTGLGLSLVQDIVNKHRGWISVDSDLGVGTTFKVFLPVVGSGSVSLPMEPARASRLLGECKHVLLVEDDPVSRSALIRLFEKHNFRVSCAESSVQAQEFFEREKGSFDLLVSDIVLPGQNGYELACEFVERNSALPVILCSGYHDEVVDIESIRSAGFRFLNKPFDLQELLGEVSDLFKERAGGAP